MRLNLYLDEIIVIANLLSHLATPTNTKKRTLEEETPKVYFVLFLNLNLFIIEGSIGSGQGK
jgi:hypothetical protein